MIYKTFLRAVDAVEILFELTASAKFDPGEYLVDISNAQHETVMLVRGLAEQGAFQVVCIGGGLIEAAGRFRAAAGTLVRLVVRAGGVEIEAGGTLTRIEWPGADVRRMQAVRHSEKLALHCNAFDMGFLWRNFAEDSGYPSLSVGIDKSAATLRPGLSFLIRAKNEVRTIERCLESLAAYRDEIVFVDNGSTDGTFGKALEVQSRFFNIRTFRYPVAIPRAGKAHAAAVLNQESNTLGHYYNFCLSKSSRFNFIKWDADYIALTRNLEEMIRLHMLRTRGDNFALWCSGLEIFTDGKSYWLDTRSRHSEWRAFSKLAGAKWVNLLPWEEIEQSYIHKANKAAYLKPVYAELFWLEEREFADRGVFEEDLRDKERLAFIREYKETGNLSDPRFKRLDSLDLDYLAEQPLSPIEVARAGEKMVSFAQVPHTKLFERTVVERWKEDQLHYVVLVMSCERNRERKRWMESTWVKDFRRKGVPVFFVYGRPGQASCLVGNDIFLDVEDNYENLVMKVCEAFKFVRELTKFSHIFKVDDDVCLSVVQLEELALRGVDYTGGRLVHDQVRLDWHVGKCENRQCDEMVIRARKSVNWFDGGSTYCLSVAAVDTVIAHMPAIFSEMYEDQAIASAISDNPALKVARLAPYRGYKVPELPLRGGVFYIGDITDEVVMHAKYRGMKAKSAYREPYEVDADWMDFAAVAERLNLSEAYDARNLRASLEMEDAEPVEAPELTPLPVVREIVNDGVRARIVIGLEGMQLKGARNDKLALVAEPGRAQLVLDASMPGKEFAVSVARSQAGAASVLMSTAFSSAEEAEDVLELARQLPKLIELSRPLMWVLQDFDRGQWLDVAQSISDALLPSKAALPRRVEIDADHVPEAGSMFFAIERDQNRRPYRWTGPDRTFSFSPLIDRSGSLKLTLCLTGFVDRARQTPLLLEVDGRTYELELADHSDGVMAHALIAPRSYAGPTTFSFTVPEVMKPGGPDERFLGVAFRYLRLEAGEAAAASLAESVAGNQSTLKT